MDAGVSCKISSEEAKIKIWPAAGRASERTIKCWFVRARPIHAMLKKSSRGMQLGQDPLVVSVGNGFRRFGGDLKIGRGIGVFVESFILKIIADDVAVL